MEKKTEVDCIVEDGQEINQLLKAELHLVPHPDLRGGSPFPGKHRFSPRQIRVLDSICEALIPSLPVHEESGPSNKPAVDRFFSLSASQAGIVNEVAGMLSAWTAGNHFLLISLTLLMLSTRIGTFLVCGLPSVTSEFPFFQPFAALDVARRESILVNWSSSFIFKLQMFFKVLKCYTLFKFYSRADKHGSNPAWEAIGYEVPSLVSEHEDPLPTSLESRLADANSPELHTRLKELGCEMLESDTENEITIKCDVVVIGSGSGGAVVAAKLAEAGFSVVIVEKGGYYPRKGLSLLEGPSMQAMYEQSGALTTEDGSVILLAATTLGGGSAVNWAASLQTPRGVLQEWSEVLRLHQFTGEDYRRAMDSVCARLGVQELCGEESFQNQVLRRGCTAAGYPVGSVPRNAGRDHDCGFCGFGCPAATAAARKQSALDTWLRDAAAAGAVVLTSCRADRVLTAPRLASGSMVFKATGVVCRTAHRTVTISSRVVVAAGGALHTPPLLRRSGLRNPHIGRHLSIHPVAAAWGYFPRGDIPGCSYRGGIMTSFSTAGPGCILETPSVHPGTFSVLYPWRSGLHSKQAMLKYPRTATIIVLNRDRGEGTVDEQHGKLVVEYSVSAEDEQSLRTGAEQAVRVLAAAGAEELGTNCVNGEVFKSGGDLEVFVKRTVGGMFQGLSTPIVSAHQMGSCRMGVDPMCSAVDPECQTWEVEGLFVGDGSVLPTSTGINPMITIQSVAYCTSKYVERYLRNRLPD